MFARGRAAAAPAAAGGWISPFPPLCLSAPFFLPLSLSLLTFPAPPPHPHPPLSLSLSLAAAAAASTTQPGPGTWSRAPATTAHLVVNGHVRLVGAAAGWLRDAAAGWLRKRGDPSLPRPLSHSPHLLAQGSRPRRGKGIPASLSPPGGRASLCAWRQSLYRQAGALSPSLSRARAFPESLLHPFSRARPLRTCW